MFPLHVSQCLLSAFVVLFTTYPELSKSSEMLHKRHGTRHINFHGCFRFPSRNQTNNPGSSSLGECRSSSASIEIVEHTCPVSSADPVQRDPCVPPVPSPQYGLDLGGYDRYPSMHVPLGAVPPLPRYKWIFECGYDCCPSVDETMGTVTTVAPCDMSPMPCWRVELHAAVFERR